MVNFESRLVFLVLCSWVLLTITLFTGSIQAKKEQELYIPEDHRLSINDVAISPDDQYIVSGGRDGTLRLWDLNKGMQIKTYKGHAR